MIFLRMLVIGCGDLEGEPTQPLLSKGAGGLPLGSLKRKQADQSLTRFLDMDRQRIRAARAEHSASNWMILNLTATPYSIAEILKTYSTYLPDVEA